MNLFLSPHLDDAALSCGGTIWSLARAGEAVVVVTICAGDTPDSVAASPAVQRVHEEWRLGDHPYRQRREEDVRACRRLDAQPIHLPLLDAVYRQNSIGQMLYARKFIGARVKSYDRNHHARALRSQFMTLRDRFPGARVYCPLAFAAHVDHVIVREAAERVYGAGGLIYYEDYPYCELADEGAWAEATAERTSDPKPLPPEALNARIAAIAEYRSQLFALFGERDPAAARAVMADRVGKYFSRVSGERFWIR